MRHQITVSDETFMRLKALAEPFIDQPEDVIRRLLDQNGRPLDPAKPSRKSNGPTGAPVPVQRDRSPDSRLPRERGARVQIGDYRIEAVSVRELYQQALKFLVENHKAKLQTILPHRTSSERYLIAHEPVHPSGNPFVVPVEFRGFHMEAHKDYKNAVEHLRILAGRLGLTLQYLG
jgi:hypothetical protein